MTRRGSGHGGFGAAGGRVLFAAIAVLLTLASPRAARAQEKREVALIWDSDKKFLFATLAFRDVVDDEIRKKLNRGFTTTIVLTGALYRPGATKPVSTTTQICKITWIVWDEVYRVEITRPDGNEVVKTVTVNGVLRRCAEAKELLVGTKGQVPFGVPLLLQGKVQVNPVSQEVLQKIKRWVSRPSATGTASAGDALFSTFTGLFLQRIGEAERELKFSTRTVKPTVKPKPKKETK